ncbi:MAG: hypothetical protein CME70_12540 [Halobacteriovorax sp.]|nr:hypothetical protein [Halobacteriovorax sp.]
MRAYLVLFLFFSPPSFACKKGVEALGKVVDQKINGRFPLRPEALQSKLKDVKDIIPKSLSTADEKVIAKFIDDAHNSGPIRSQMDFFERRKELEDILSKQGHLNERELAESILNKTFNQRHIGNENSFAHALNNETSDFIQMSGYTYNKQALQKGLDALDDGKKLPAAVQKDLRDLARDIDDFEMVSMRNSFRTMNDKASESKSWIEGFATDTSKKEITRNPSLNPYKPSVDPSSIKTKNPDIVKLKLEGQDSSQGAWEFILKKGDDKFVYVRDLKTGLEIPIKDNRAWNILRGRAYREWAVANPREAKVKNLAILEAELEKGTHAIRDVMSSLLGDAKQLISADIEKSSQVISNINQLKSKSKLLADSVDDAEAWELKGLIQEVQKLYNSL